VFCYGRVSRALALIVLTFAAACSSSSPTGPSPASSSSAGTTAQESGDGAAANTQAPVGATRFLAFGDSITFGTASSFDLVSEDIAAPAATCLVNGTPPAEAYPNQLGPVLASASPVQTFTVTNCGIGGEAAFNGEQRLSGLLGQFKPQGLLLLEGINDLNGGRSIDETVGHLRTMIEIARLYNVTVLIGTMFQTYQSEQELPDGSIRVRENSAAQVPAFNAAILQMAQGRQNVYVVDIYHAFGANRSLVGNDGLHPTPSGYQRMAEWFGTTIAQAWAVRVALQ
jgi:lysophospholipase L1-like esterase